ncbi:MAG: flavodoxin-dependent (E)-4-hydroxy-3-methylbut-2-enyl-diphosphate synthase [candidate division WOR-3 bacterium]|nr:MAG: flavodoxin-dependent (E)-4-hydroxy-3-methylbut-2-enyl-diphosphate synthase [candidate division WOR-3 bacterium]
MRKLKRVVTVGDVKIGGNNPIVVQSMTKTKTRQIKRTVNQIRRLQKAGCELVRLAVVNKDDVSALGRIKKSVSVPLIADVHFDYRLALGAIDMGVDKLRINPGTISEIRKIEQIIEKAREKNVPLRIGINSGSLPKVILKKYHHPTPEAIIETVTNALDIFAQHNFDNIVISAKGVEVKDTVDVYEAIDKQCDFPLHLGITEAGTSFRGGIRSAVGLGILLNEGIGDTVRVSLTADPVKEVIAAYEILGALGLRQHGPILMSCPVCGRCEVNLEPIARAVEKRLQKYDNFMKVAVMGCVVNGPGEAREADFGIACGKGVGALFLKGKEIMRVKEKKLVDTLFEVIDENINY